MPEKSGPKSRVPQSKVNADIRVQSILMKAKVYCDFYRRSRPPGDFPAGVEEGALEAAAQGRITFLRAISRELDVRVRECLAPAEQDQVIGMMVAAGVTGSDIPTPIAVRRARSLVRRGKIKSAEDELLARQVVDVAGYATLLSVEEQALLGEMLDHFLAKPGS